MGLLQPDLRPLTPDGVAVVQYSDAPGDADFVPTRTSSGTPLHWGGSCVFLRPTVAGTADLPGDDEWTQLALATAGWEAPTRGCGYLRFQLEPAEDGEVGLDYVNRVIVRETTWCRPGPPEKCYDGSAVGITTLFFVDRPGDPADGVILDADVELNAVDYALAVCNGQPGGCTTAGTGLPEDLANTLTHELGHLLGFDHTCWAGTPDTAPLDDQGVPAPPCAPTLPPEITEATMYNFEDPEEIKKRTPEADDVAAFCARYPAAADPGSCAPVTPASPDAGPDTPGDDAGGCCGAAGRPGDLLIAAWVALALGRGRRRRGRDVAACGRHWPTGPRAGS